MARYWDFYERTSPIRKKGGIKAGTSQTLGGKSWWAKRWTAVLESFNLGARLGRGRSYARQGQVLSIEVEKGSVTAQVQGSRPKPYSVSIQLKELPEASWKKVGKELSGQAILVAKLLGGEMPQDIERVFKTAAVPLFPERLRDLVTRCSCPDDSNPCKHIAAVYYLIGEEFDRDPFLLFRLRGVDRKDLFDLLGSSTPKRARVEEAPVEDEGEPLPVDLAAFWKGGPLPDDWGELEPPAVTAALPKRLGSFPFWRGDEPFLEALESIYREASERAMGLTVSTNLGE